MRLHSLTTHIMRTTAIALPLLGAPFTVKIVDQGLLMGPAQAWAESDRGGDHGGGSDGGSSHDGGGDHGSSGGGDHGGSSGGGDDHGGSGGGSHDGSEDRSQDQSRGQDRSQDQDRLEQDRDAWLGVPDRSQSGSTQASDSGGLMPVPEDRERQLIERGWAGDDAQGDHK